MSTWMIDGRKLLKRPHQGLVKELFLGIETRRKPADTRPKSRRLHNLRKLDAERTTNDEQGCEFGRRKIYNLLSSEDNVYRSEST